MIDKDFIRNRISAIRSAYRVSARQLSLDIGYSEDACNQIERGKANATIDFILAFCEYFRISISEFFESNAAIPTEFMPLISDLKNLSAEELADFSAIVRRFVAKKKG